MLKPSAAIRLLDGLIKATKAGRVSWERDTTSSVVYGGVTASVLNSLNKQILRAKIKGTLYRLSSDSLGRPPFELMISQDGDQPLDVVESSTDIRNHDAFQVNRRLQELFRTASASIVDSDGIVDKLLGDLNAE